MEGFAAVLFRALDAIWNAHPQVYLPIHRTDRQSCEWCGTVYLLNQPDPEAPIPLFSNTEIETLYLDALARVKQEKCV